MEWHYSVEKTRLDEVMDLALESGPQRIKYRNDIVVLLSEEDYLRMIGNQPSLVQFILEGPDLDDLDLSRDPDFGRHIDLR